MQEVGKYEIRVQKVGRKWLTIEGRCSKTQVEINELTKDCVEGGVYDIYAICVTDSNRYGTTRKYYPISKEEFEEKRIEQLKQEIILDKEKCKIKLEQYANYTSRHQNTRERIKSLAHGDTELLNELAKVEKDLRLNEDKESIMYLKSKIRNAKGFDSSTFYKLDYIQDKINQNSWVLERVKDEQPNLYEEVRNLAVETHKELIFNMKDFDDIFYIYENLSSIYKEEDFSDLLEEIKIKHEEYCLSKLSEIEEFYDKGIPVSDTIYPKDVYKKYRNKGYISDTVESAIADLEIKMKNLDVSKFNYTIRNIFEIKDKDAFTHSMKSIRIVDEVIEEVFDENKFFYDEKVYILSYRLEKEFFKKVVKNELTRIGNEYLCKNPYKLLYELVEGGYIEIKENSNEHDSEIEKIMLWSDELTEPFSYRKEIVNGETYYFVTKELYSEYRHDNYNAYYIVGWDSDTKRGFSHRLPWAKDKYEEMTIKDIVEDTFRLNEGFKRIQGDVIIKEYNLRKVVDNIKYLKQIITINNKKPTEYEIKSKNYTFLGVEEIDVSREKYEGKEFKETKRQYRKNIYVIGEKLYGIKSFYSDIFRNAIVYCDDKELLRFNKPVEFNTNKKGTKIKYNLYYEPVEYEISYETRDEDDIYYLVEDENGEQIFKMTKYEPENEDFYIGEHLVNSNTIKYTSTGVYCIGRFSIKHSEHNYIEYGEDGKVYNIELAIRHKKKDSSITNLYIRD